MRRLITRECLIVLLSAMVLCMVPSWAMAVGVPIGGTFMSGGLTYKVLTDTTVEVVGGFAVGDMVIPSTVTSDGTNYLVTSIGDSAFAYSSYLASVTIPTSVTLIGDSAFAHCFQLASVTIPAAVTSIGDHAFAGCYGLTAIDVSAGSASFKSSDGVLIEILSRSGLVQPVPWLPVTHAAMLHQSTGTTEDRPRQSGSYANPGGVPARPCVNGVPSTPRSKIVRTEVSIDNMVN